MAEFDIDDPVRRMSEAGYRVNVAPVTDEAVGTTTYHALAVDDHAGEYRIVSAASRPEALMNLVRQLGLEGPD